MIENEINFDVIIPLYNCERYLDRCFSSIISQTTIPLNIIFIDDGSTDSSGKMADEYSKRFSNVKVIHQTNGGLSSARNAGLQLVQNLYFTFVDPDDWVDTNYFENVAEEIDKNKPDILMVPYVRKYANKKIDNMFLGSRTEAFDSVQTRGYILKRLFGLTDKQLSHPLSIDNISTAWGKFYKTSKFSQIMFKEKNEIYSEDLFFNVQCFLKASSSEYFINTRYIYFKENESSIVHTYNSNLLKEYKQLYKELWALIDKNKLESQFHQAFNNRIVINELAILRNITLSNAKILSQLQLIRNVLNDDLYKKAYSDFNINSLPISYQVFYTACKHRMSILIFLFLRLGEKLKTVIKQ